MKRNFLRNSIIVNVLGFVLMTTVQSAPVWTFTPDASFPPSVMISSSGSATIKYTVTNHSYKVHTLRMQPIQGITPSGCTSPMGYGDSCILNLVVTGSALSGSVNGGPVLCEQNNPLQCYRPSQSNSLAINLSTGTILSPSVSTLALSTNCLPASGCTAVQNAALTGNPRQITIQNIGSSSATNVSVNALGLPSGTSISSNSCSGTLNAGASCTIVLTPGAVASSDASSAPCTSGTPPVAGTINVTADGGISTQVSIYVLGYKCQYQGGFLYSVDDTTSNLNSIGGKVVSLIDQAAPAISTGSQSTSIIWSSNGSGSTAANVSYDIIPLIAANSSQISYSDAQTYFNATYTNTGIYPFPSSGVFATCSGATDGACNSSNILAFYNTYKTNYDPLIVSGSISPGPTPLNYYPAGVCSSSINAYSDWYLPAICEMDAIRANVTCPLSEQDMLRTLSSLVGDPSALTPNNSCTPPTGTDCLAGSYWSSTSGNSGVLTPYLYAFDEYFDIAGNFRSAIPKNTRLGVRCSRALTV